MKRLTATILCSIMLLMVCSPMRADRGAGSLRLTATPTAIPADGKSISTISAEVRDRDGSLVPDGTEVHFSASLGVIEETADTSAGVARARLTSSDIAGDCVVTATWIDGPAVSQTTVVFGSQDAEPEGPEYIDLNADDYMAYSIDYKVLEAIGKVRMRYRSIEMTADEVQVDLEMNRILARSSGRDTPIRIKMKDKTITGDLLVCDITTLQGQLLSISAGSSQQVDLRKGVTVGGQGETAYLPEDLDFFDLSDSGVLVKSKEATIFPGTKIQFKGAGMYVNGKRTIYLPFYVLSLNGYQEEESQYVGYSTGGLTLNLPLYYSLTPSSNGALLVRHGESSGWGWYGQKPGWFLDLRERYDTPNSSGEVLFTQVTDSDWGARFTHTQQLDSRTSGYAYIDWAAHKDLYGALNLNRNFDSFSAGLNFYGSQMQYVGDSQTAELSLQTRSRRVGKLPARFTISSKTSYSTGSSLGDYAGAQQRLLGNVYSDPWKLSTDLSLRTSLSLGYLWGSRRASGLSSIATAVMDWKISPSSSLQLNYRFADRATSYSSSTFGKQSLSANLRLSDGKKWAATMFMMKGLDYTSMNLLADLSYYLNENWRLGLRSTYNTFDESSYNDTEFALGRKFGTRELMAVWSKSQNKIMFELGSGGF